MPVCALLRAVAMAGGIGDQPLTTLGAVHGSTVARVDEPKDVLQGVDGLITNSKGVALFATYADCYPIVLWDPLTRSVGLPHAGCRGTVAGVAKATVKSLHH